MPRKRRPPVEVEFTRIDNLNYLVDRHGGRESLALKCGWETKAFISHLTTQINPFTESSARRIEDKLELPNGWMDIEHAEVTAFSAASVQPKKRWSRPDTSDREAAQVLRIQEEVKRVLTTESACHRLRLPLHLAMETLGVLQRHAERNGGIVDLELTRDLVKLMALMQAHE